MIVEYCALLRSVTKIPKTLLKVNEFVITALVRLYIPSTLLPPYKNYKHGACIN